jgi:EAL domain-containing protein (putative c-di-GMP-specific phosphodiesterase class I)
VIHALRENLGVAGFGPDEIAAAGSLREMLGGPGFSMAFQPIVDLRSDERIGFEALARFRSEELLDTGAVFKEARRVGVESELELAAVSRALTDGRPIREGALDGFLAINASPSTICSGTLVDMLDAEGVANLVLEVTEHAAINDYAAFAREVAPLRERGVRLAVDDVGAGYASLRHVLQLAPDIIKLDVSLTRGIDRDQGRRAMAAGLISFAQQASQAVIAEGIENAAEARTILDLGVVYGQGFHLGLPGPLPDEPVRDLATGTVGSP